MNPSLPEQSGFSSARLKQLDTLFGEYVAGQKLVGIAATVARKGQTVYLNKFGLADTQPEKPLEYDTIYRIASMTKPVTSVAAMMLYEQGKFHLNTPVYEFIPGFRDLKVFVRANGDDLEVEDLKGPLTMRNLFTHTSGLTYGFIADDPIDRLLNAKLEVLRKKGGEFNAADVVGEIQTLPLAFQPGTQWRYGMNIEVLGHIIEILSGQSLADYMAQHIFEPLGMPDTGFYVPEGKLERLAAVYGRPESPDKMVRLDFRNQTTLPRFQSGGGGLVSTLPDYARFCQMLVNGGELNGTRLLSPTTVAMYSANQCPEQALPLNYAGDFLYHAGYGFSLATRVLMTPAKTGIYGSAGEFGWDGAFGTYFWVDPVESLYGLLMIQYSPNAYFPIAIQFKQLAYAALIR